MTTLWNRMNGDIYRELGAGAWLGTRILGGVQQGHRLDRGLAQRLGFLEINGGVQNKIPEHVTKAANKKPKSNVKNFAEKWRKTARSSTQKKQNLMEYGVNAFKLRPELKKKLSTKWRKKTKLSRVRKENGVKAFKQPLNLPYATPDAIKRLSEKWHNKTFTLNKIKERDIFKNECIINFYLSNKCNWGRGGPKNNDTTCKELSSIDPEYIAAKVFSNPTEEELKIMRDADTYFYTKGEPWSKTDKEDLRRSCQMATYNKLIKEKKNQGVDAGIERPPPPPRRPQTGRRLYPMRRGPIAGNVKLYKSVRRRFGNRSRRAGPRRR